MGQVRHIFRWDLDKTYLKTDFDSVRDLVRTARMTAEERQNVPGSRALLRVIQEESTPSSRHLVYFISGSPEQLRGTIERKFALDGISPDGFTLKPTVQTLLKGRFRAVRNQVPYKLGELLAQRLEAPVGTPETLFGDDAESDALVYCLYADVMSGKLSRPKLMQVLRRTRAYQEELEAIESLLDLIIHEDVVQRVVIHLDRRTPPAAFYAFSPLAIPVHDHLQAATVLALDGTLSGRAIRSVTWELLERYQTSRSFLVESVSNLLRRQSTALQTHDLKRVAQELERQAEAIKSDAEAGDKAKELKAALRDLALCLQSARTRPEASGSDGVTRDYERLLEEEVAHKQEFGGQLEP